MEVGPKTQKNIIKALFIIPLFIVSFTTISCVTQAYELGTNQENSKTFNTILKPQAPSKLSSFINKVVDFVSQTTKSSEEISIVGQSNENNNDNLCKLGELNNNLTDISNNKYKDYINTLYQRGIVIGSNNKFMPDDDLRFYCMIKIIVDSYRSKIGYDINTQIGLSQKNYLPYVFSGVDKTSLKYLNTAYELGFLHGISEHYILDEDDYLKQNVDFTTVKKLLENVNKQFPLLVNNDVINQLPLNSNFVKRGEYTKYIVDLFEFPIETGINSCSGYNSTLGENNFSDIMDNDYKEDIEVLAELGIINSQAHKFYPDNYLRNYEFIIMLTKTILYKENQELNIYTLDHTSNISDLDSNASYIKYFEYAYHNGFINYGFDPNTGKPMVYPNKFVTIQEINNILSKLVGEEINFKAKSFDGLVTRGEFADMLVDGFALNDLYKNSDTNNINHIESSISDNLLIKEIGGRLKSAKLISKL
ncbi:S-layer homology domain-containing protein [Candidatus Gracilibacteria bacterium]|nr:S-layer homology domain-containing protein [Candidatus Gracilibacteria bacterium]